MKKIFLFLVLALGFNAYSQNASVEKSIFGIQTGFAGVWINNESKLSNSIVLRSELGIEHDFFIGDQYDGAGFILEPVLTLEPKFYYNLKNRSSRGKNASKNSGNYISVKISYHPDWFVINLDDDITKTADLSIVPTWGIKRQIGTNFTYETGVGLGYRVVFLKPGYNNGNAQNVDGISENKNQYTPYLHLRIGYAF